MAKDSQVSKVYRGEDKFLHYQLHQPNTNLRMIDFDNWYQEKQSLDYEIGRAQRLAFLNRNYAGRWFSKSWAVDNALMDCGRSSFGFTKYSTWDVYGSNLWIYHNLAHHCAHTHQHDASFVRAYLEIVGRFIGVDAKKAMTRCFLDQKVKTRVISKETRQKQKIAYETRRDKGRMVENLEAMLKMAKEL